MVEGLRVAATLCTIWLAMRTTSGGQKDTGGYELLNESVTRGLAFFSRLRRAERSGWLLTRFTHTQSYLPSRQWGVIPFIY
ncbi:hypothetical protein F4808DRAFT_412090 [Astrocystis sublimbata]|nr:hypothetical protein F4808DRAFT_412090 [Astrocystis sublimbata]